MSKWIQDDSWCLRGGESLILILRVMLRHGITFQIVTVRSAGLSVSNLGSDFIILTLNYCFFWRSSPQWARASSFTSFSRSYTQQRTTASRTTLDEWSACLRELYLTTHNTQKRQTSMPPVGIEPTIPASEQPQTHALDRAATRTGLHLVNELKCMKVP